MIRPSKRKLVLYAAVAIPCLLLAGVWLGRASLGVWAVTDYLRRQGAPARITVDRLTLNGFAGSAAIGPAADPDLVVDRIEADYALFPDRRFAPRVDSVRLSGVRLKAAYDGKSFKLGSLQRLVDQALASPGGGPSPRVQFDRAAVRLTTPAGALDLTGQGLIDGGRLQRLALAVSAPRLVHQGLVAAGVRGTLTATGGDRLAAQLTLAADQAQADETVARTLALRATADLPYGRDPDRMFDGPATLDATLQAASATAGGWTAADGGVRLDLSGALAGGLRSPRFAGRAALAAQADSLGGAGATLTRPGLTLTSAEAQASLANDRFLAVAPVSGRFAASAGTVDAGGRTARLSGIDVRADGPASAGDDGFIADLRGSAQAMGSFSAADARGLADQLAPQGAMPALNQSLRTALASWRAEAPSYRVVVDNGSTTVRLLRPARATFSDGAVVLSAAPNAPLAAVGASGTAGALRLAASGEGLPSLDLAVSQYSLGEAGLSGAAHLTATGDVLPVEGLDLAADLRLSPAGAQSVLRLAACGPLGAKAVRAGPDPLVTDFKGLICPAAEPLAVLGPGRWRAAAALRDAAFALPAAQAGMADGVVQISLGGAGGGKPAGTFVLTGGRLTDGLQPARFSAMALEGRFTLADDRIEGRLGAGLAGRADQLAGVDVLHDLPSGEGRAVLETTRLDFVQDGLQPDDLAPAAGVVSRVQGPVDVSARFGWGPAGVTGSASAVIEGLDLSAPGGRLLGLRGRIDFPALMPVVVTAPDQHLTAERFESAVPLTALDLRFALDAEALRIAGASAELAKGSITLDSLALSLTPRATASSALHLAGVDLGEIVSTLNLADSVKIEARVKASLPFSLTPEGIRIANGRIAAEGPGRLSIARAALTGVSTSPAAAQATAPGAPPAPVSTNAVQDFAYQALENLAFDSLDATVDSRPMGRLGVIFHLAGRHDPERAQQARIRLFDLARGTAFDEPIPLPKGTPVDLTLDTSLNFDDLMAAYGRIGRSDAVQP